MQIDSEVVLIGLAVVSAIGGLIARDRSLVAMINNGDKASTDSAKQEHDVLHERINKTRDEFVRRVDLDQHLIRIERSIANFHEEQKGTNKRIDDFMAAMVGDGK